MSNRDLGFNLKPGINYCTASLLGFRGVAGKPLYARLIPLHGTSERVNAEEMFLFFGVDVPASELPYIPDMSPGSLFVKKGAWHYYNIKGGVVIDYLRENGHGGFHRDRVLMAFAFSGEAAPRVFIDRRRELLSDSTLTEVEMKKVSTILKTHGFIGLDSPQQ